MEVDAGESELFVQDNAEERATTFTTEQSLDVLAYLLQQNGLPSGSTPLTDTRELSDVLPEK